jgi:hypothetical protein
MNPLAHLLLITALSIPTATLVLRSGERIAVDGNVRLEDGRILFRAGGTLYSVRSEDVDLDATRAASSVVTVTEERRGKLKVTAEERDRLLRELEQNHSGKPAPAGAFEYPSGPTPSERQQETRDEWSWKNTARSYEESIRRAQEELDLLVDRAGALKAHIAGLLALGHKPSEFTYDTTQLAYLLDQIPNAELEVRRAERAYAQFRDDARRQGVDPGWLR